MATSRYYVTTSIPYVNGAPHLGHALELVQADVLARHGRSRGRQVRFLTGTDDNALKNVAAARAAGVPTREFVDANAARFAALHDPLALSVDDVIRTGADPRHPPGVRRLWERCAARGDFYRRRYTGRYCAGCEQFYAAAELPGGLCPEHGVAPEAVAEENWFFRLSRHQDELLRVLESGTVRIEPAARRAEVLAFVRAGLRDISVSRPAERAGGWGIPVPGDPGQVVYVWWDALANYVTALGYGGATGDDAYRDWWAGSDSRVHVIGKGIVRFHAVYWLAQLLSAELPLPTTILVHDYLTADGAKLAKSGGSGPDPADVVRRYGADALRWWFVREVPRTGDTDFTEQRLVARHDLELANGLGNLVQRTLTLVHRLHDGAVGAPGRGPLTDAADALPAAVDRAVDGFDLRAATAALVGVVDLANRTIEAERPWAPDRRAEAGAVLASLVHACRVVAAELTPFLPGGAARLRAQLAEGERAGRPEPSFLRLGRA